MATSSTDVNTFQLSNTRRRRRPGALAAAGLAAALMLPVLLAATPAQAAAGSGGSGSGAQHHRQAVAVARRLLTDVILPIRTRTSTTQPKGSGPLLSRPAQLPATPNLVDDKVFVVVNGQAPKVVKWFDAHPPTGSKLTGTGELTSNGKTQLWMADFSWPGVHNVLFSEDIILGAVRLSGGSTAIRMDSQVTWLPGRSRLDTVPAGAVQGSILVAVPKANGAPGKLLEPTIRTRNLGIARDITNDVNALQVLLPGVYPCPPGPDLDIYVEFRTHLKAAPDAVTTAYPYGCAFVNMEAHGQTSPQILVDGGVLAGQLKGLVGLKLPPVPAGVHGG